MLTSIVILTFNQLEYTKMCIDSIRNNTSYGSYEIIIVDNNSVDGTVEWLKLQKDIKTIFNSNNKGFAAGCNQGISISIGDNILLLNNDVVVTSNWLDNLLSCLYSSEEIGAVGPITNYCSNKQAVDVDCSDLNKMHKFASINNISNPNKWEERLRLIGFCILVKRSVLNRVGLLDELFGLGSYEDNDLCLRIRLAGYRIKLCNDTFIYHFGSVSFKNSPQAFINLDAVNRNKFKDKWKLDPHVYTPIYKEVTNIIKDSYKKDPVILQIGCDAGGTLLDIKNKLPCSQLYGLQDKSKELFSNHFFANIIFGTEVNINMFSKSYFDYIIISTNNPSLDFYLNHLISLLEFLNSSGGLIIVLPRHLEENLNSIIQALTNLFGNNCYKMTICRSYNDFRINYDIILSIKFIDKDFIDYPKDIDSKKISFITCVNDNFVYSKALDSIGSLIVPQNYHIEIISIHNAKSLTEGYNIGLKNSNAKYKVYLHQDVTILNKNFINEFLNIFQKYTNVGLLGVAGSKNIPPQLEWWFSDLRYGEVFDSHEGMMGMLKFKQVVNDYEPVILIDGLIMITQYDIFWREDVFSGWHYYDASQCLEYAKRGYIVAVPKQRETWCIHDCGIITLGDDFNYYGKVFEGLLSTDYSFIKK